MATAEHGMKLDSKTAQEEILQTGCMPAAVHNIYTTAGCGSGYDEASGPATGGVFSALPTVKES